MCAAAIWQERCGPLAAIVACLPPLMPPPLCPLPTRSTDPPDTVKSRLQVQGSGSGQMYSGTVDAFAQIARREVCLVGGWGEEKEERVCIAVPVVLPTDVMQWPGWMLHPNLFSTDQRCKHCRSSLPPGSTRLLQRVWGYSTHRHPRQLLLLQVPLLLLFGC